MDNLIKCLKTALLAILMVSSAGAWAASGRAQAVDTPNLSIDDIVSFSKQVEHTLAKNRARVAFISRVGRSDDELPKGIKYTHVGIAVYSNITLEDGTSQPGYAIYNLYQDGEKMNRSKLVQDYPLDFYRQVFSLKTGIIIPKEELQTKLLEVIQSPTFEKMHNSTYSAISNPFNNRTQNCNEFIMNVTQAAIYQTDDLKVIKQSLEQHFTAFELPINPFKILFGAMTSKEITATDHKGKYQTIIFGSMKQYFEEHELASKILEFEFDS